MVSIGRNVLASMGEEKHERPDYANTGGEDNIPPEILQHAMTIFAQEHGRQAATDSDMWEIQKIVDQEMGVSPKGAVDAETDPNDAQNFSDNEGPRANGDGVGAAAKQFIDDYDAEDPAADWSAADAYDDAGLPGNRMQNMKPKHAIPDGWGEDDMPYSNTVDYGSGVDPRLDPHAAQSPAGGPMPMEGPVPATGYPMMPNMGVAGDEAMMGPLDALVAQMMGTGGGGMGNMGGTVAAGPQQMESRLPPGQANPNEMEDLIQMLMSQPGARR